MERTVKPKALGALIDEREEEMRRGHTESCEAGRYCVPPSPVWTTACDRHGLNACKCTCGHWTRMDTVRTKISSHRTRQ